MGSIADFFPSLATSSDAIAAGPSIVNGGDDPLAVVRGFLIDPEATGPITE